MRLEKAVECCRKDVEVVLLSTLPVAGTGHKNNIGVVPFPRKGRYMCVFDKTW